jgi:hypothetical protein
VGEQIYKKSDVETALRWDIRIMMKMTRRKIESRKEGKKEGYKSITSSAIVHQEIT